jgi:hypothetical protein
MHKTEKTVELGLFPVAGLAADLAAAFLDL